MDEHVQSLEEQSTRVVVTTHRRFLQLCTINYSIPWRSPDTPGSVPSLGAARFGGLGDNVMSHSGVSAATAYEHMGQVLEEVLSQCCTACINESYSSSKRGYRPGQKR